MDSDYHLSVPNSNPNSAFSHYEITGEIVDERPVMFTLVGVMAFTLVGVYSENSGKSGKRTIRSGFTNLETLKTLLADINGPITEEAENVD